jgi:hypothetical protein
LSQIAVNEGATVGDGINLTKFRGKTRSSGVQTASSTGGSGGTGSSSYKFITYPSGVPTGDVDYTVVRPMGTFVIKLLDNTSADTFNFANLRRFNYYSRAASTNYSVAANKNSSGTVKQLGVIGLDANGNEVARTYYVVYPNGTTGHSTNALTQVTLSSGDILGTFEEDVNGGYDNNYTGQYWLIY